MTTEYKKVVSEGRRKVVNIPSKSSISVGDYVKITKLETSDNPAKNVSEAISDKANNE